MLMAAREEQTVVMKGGIVHCGLVMLYCVEKSVMTLGIR